MYILEIQIDKFLNEIQHLFSCRRCPGDIRTLVETVDNDINRALSLQAQHALDAFGKLDTIRFPCAVSVLGIQLREGVVTRIRFGGKLGKEGGEEAIEILLLHIPKIKIIKGHCGQSSRTQVFDVLYDRRTNREYE